MFKHNLNILHFIPEKQTHQILPDVNSKFEVNNVLVLYYYIKNQFKTQQLKQTIIIDYLLQFPLGQVFRNGLSEWFCVRVPHEVTGWQVRAGCFLFQEASVPHKGGLSTGLLESPHSMATRSPRTSNPRDHSGSFNVFHDHASEVTHGHFHDIPLVIWPALV